MRHGHVKNLWRTGTVTGSDVGIVVVVRGVEICWFELLCCDPVHTAFVKLKFEFPVSDIIKGAFVRAG